MEIKSLSHKREAMDFAWMRFWRRSFVLLLFFLTAHSGIAQEPGIKSSEYQNQEDIHKFDAQGSDKEQGRYQTFDVLQTGQESGGMGAEVTVPIHAKDDGTSLGAQTFENDVFLNRRNHLGFSLSAYQTYASALYEDDQHGDSAGITAFAVRTFLNIGRRKSQFHIDLSAGYRHYNSVGNLDTWDYNGNVSYSLQCSKRASFHLKEQFTSSYNDSWSFLSLYSPISHYPNSSNEVIFNRQRINRNALTAEFDFRLNRKVQFGFFGADHYYDFSRNTLGAANAYEAGTSINFQITKWLQLTSKYSAYLNRVDDHLSDARIHRLQLGGLDYRLTHSWRIWAGSGVEISSHLGENRASESIDAGIGYDSHNTSFSVTYQRGFTSAIGLSKLLKSDVVSALLGCRIASWMRASLQSYYYRSSELGARGLLRTFSSEAGLEFAISRNIIASMNGFYQNQNTRNFSTQGLGINRITGYIGLQYSWPSRS
jgi:hypothetical protein